MRTDCLVLSFPFLFIKVLEVSRQGFPSLICLNGVPLAPKESPDKSFQIFGKVEEAGSGLMPFQHYCKCAIKNCFILLMGITFSLKSRGSV